MNKTKELQKVKELQIEFGNAIRVWHDLLWNFNFICEEREILPERYADEDVLHALKIFSEVVGNVAIHRMIEKDTKIETGEVFMEELGEELNKFVKKWTGIDTKLLT